MTVTIADLTSATALASGDQVPLSSANSRDTLKMSLSLLLAWMQANLAFTNDVVASQYAAPSATGFSVTVASGNSRLILTPLAGYAAGTIVLPTDRVDGDKVIVNCTQAVTTLTVSGAGTTVTGAPATLAANAFFTMQYDGVTAAWYRVA